MKQLDVSVIITAHNEGIIAHKTMLSIFRAVAELRRSNATCEIIVHIDNGSDETMRYFSRYDDDPSVRIIKNSFKDLSESRNAAIKAANGAYVAICDADDIYSKDWLINLYRVVKNGGKIIARPEYIITFGDWPPRISHTAITPEEELLYFFDSNIYGSPCMIKRSYYMQCMQRRNHPPYGYEDWQWNIDMAARGFIHKTAPKTALFYRKDHRHKQSLLSKQSIYRATLSKSRFFDFTTLKRVGFHKTERPSHSASLPTIYHVEHQSRLRQFLKDKAYHTMVYLNSFTTLVAIKQFFLGRESFQSPVEESAVKESYPLPEWLLQEWAELNHIEKLLFPDDYVIDNLQELRPDRRVGEAYLDFVQSVERQPDTLFFVPYLHAGGADRVFLTAANFLARKRHWSITMIQTEVEESPWKRRLEGVDYYNLAQAMEGIPYSHDRSMQLIAQLVEQNDIKRIIIGNSRLAYDFVIHYKTLLRHRDVTVYTFNFAGAISDNGRIGGYMHEELPLIQDVVHKIITDNSQSTQEIIKQHAINPAKCMTVHQYTDVSCGKIATYRRRLRILWASRISPEKLPEVAFAIAEALGDDGRIDMYGTLEGGYTEDAITSSGVVYKGAFSDINTLPVDAYDAFLYTSRCDGMPNILLEMAAKGLPIIAPKVGGIGDFIIHNETGILVDDPYDKEQYVSGLRTLRDARMRRRLAENAQYRLKKEFSREQWEGAMMEVFTK